MAFNQSEYIMQYYKDNIVRKVLNFNTRIQDDAQLLAWLEKQGNFSQYVKALVKRDMENQQRSK